MFQVGTREEVQEFVPKVAALVKKYATPLLRGDESAYRSALEFRGRQYADEGEVNVGNVKARVISVSDSK